MQPKVSIVIPVYNSDEYLEQCLDSVLGQTLQDVEVICVDDGSTDRSCEILERYANADERFRFLKQDHLFAGVARNKGLAEAQGEYVIFLDSDDFFHHEMLENMYVRAEETQADIVICGGQRFNTVTQKSVSVPGWLQVDIIGDNTIFNRDDIPEEIFNVTNPAPWNKLFKRDFIESEHILFQDIHNANDVYFTEIALCMARRISFVNFSYVNYRVGSKLNLQSTRAKGPLCLFEAIEAVYDELQRRGLFSSLEKSFVRFALENISHHIRTFPESDDRFNICTALTEPHFTRMGIMSHSQEYYEGIPAWNVIRGALLALNLHRQYKARMDNVATYIKLVKRLNGISFDEPPVLSVCLYVEHDKIFDWDKLECVLQQYRKNVELIFVCNNYADINQKSLNIFMHSVARISVYTSFDADCAAIKNAVLQVASTQYISFWNCSTFQSIEQFFEFLSHLQGLTANVDALFCGLCRVPFNSYGMPRYEISNSVEIKKQNDNSGLSLLRFLVDAGLTTADIVPVVLNRSFLLARRITFTSAEKWNDETFNLCVLIAAQNVSFLSHVCLLPGGPEEREAQNVSEVLDLFATFMNGLLAYNRFAVFNEEQAIVSTYLRSRLKLARKKQAKLEPYEQYAWWGLPRAEAIAFNLLVVDHNENRRLLREERAAVKVLQKSAKKAEARIQVSENTISNLEQRLAESGRRLSRAEEALKAKEQALKDALLRVKNTKNSITYKIGRVVVFVPKSIVGFIRKMFC